MGTGYVTKSKTKNIEQEYNKGSLKFPTPGKKDPLKITIKKNKINIVWNIKFKGKNVKKKAYKTGKTYRNIIKAAIKSKWDNTYKIRGHKVSVTVKITESSKKNRSTIYFYNKKGIPNGLWSGGGHYGYMSLYTGDSRNNKSFTLRQFKRAAAHEFGHVAGVGYDGPATKNSIMCDPMGRYNGTGKAVNKDIKKVIDSYKKGSPQNW